MSTAATLYTGLDLHKRTVVATTLDADGVTVARRKLPARTDALALYFADLPIGYETEHLAVAEATTGWYWVKDAARKHASPTAYRNIKNHGRGHGEGRFHTWNERVAREIPTAARVAFDVSEDPDIDLNDPEAVYALLRVIYGPMATEIKQWRNWLVEEHWALYSRAGGNGRFVEGPCGFAFDKHLYAPSEQGKKYATNRLQGSEATFIHHLTLLQAEYGYEVLANEHDGLVVLGSIPEEAVALARTRSGFRTAEIEPKPFWKGSTVGLLDSWLSDGAVVEDEATEGAADSEAAEARVMKRRTASRAHPPRGGIAAHPATTACPFRSPTAE
ncbi:MAG: hypothetical protein AAFU38_10385 [Bacteroidota bacterium]